MLKLESPALAAIFSEIIDSQNKSILDLGEMRAGTFNFFSSRNCHFLSENLREFIIEYQQDPSSHFKDKIDQFLRFDQQEKKFDVVLMWDLLNYLSLDQVIEIFDRLKPFCNENALVHTFTYMTKSIPTKPARVTILDNEHITVDIKKPLKPNQYKHTSLSLVKNIADFMMETNLFSNTNLKTGIKEDLLRFVPHLQNQQKNLTKKEYSYQQPGSIRRTNARINKKETLKSYQLPGLFSVLKNCKQNPDAAILDLGHDNRINGVELLSFAAKVIPENLPALFQYEQGQRSLMLKSRNISFTPSVSFHTILLWDLFHYLTPDEMTEVVERLNHCCQPGTLIHMICYSTSTIANKPQLFYIQKDERILLQETKEKEKPDKPLNSMALMKVFKNADIKQTFLLKPQMPSGLCELVLKVKDKH